jgi:hypothetical protein
MKGELEIKPVEAVSIYEDIVNTSNSNGCLYPLSVYCTVFIELINYQ